MEDRGGELRKAKERYRLVILVRKACSIAHGKRGEEVNAGKGIVNV